MSLRYLLTRLLTGIGVMWGVVTLVFLLLRVAPGDPARLDPGPVGHRRAGGSTAAPAGAGPPGGGAVRRLAIAGGARRSRHQHRDGPPGRRDAGRSVAGHCPARFPFTPAQLPPRNPARAGAGRRERDEGGHGALDRERDAVRDAELLAGGGAGAGLRLLVAGVPGLRGAGSRRGVPVAGRDGWETG